MNDENKENIENNQTENKSNSENQKRWWKNILLKSNLQNKILYINLMISIFIGLFLILFVNFQNYISNKLNNIITKELPKMNQYHSNHLSLNLEDGNVLILGNNISYGITEIYLKKNKRFKIYNKDLLGTYLLYADDNYVFYSDKNNIYCYNPNENFSLKFKIALNENIIHPKISFIDKNQFLIWGGWSAPNKISKRWQIYDISIKQVISTGYFDTEVNENSQIVKITSNLFLFYTNNIIYKMDRIELFSKNNVTCNELGNIYNLQIHKTIRVNDSVLITFSDNLNKKNLNIALLDINKNKIKKIITTKLNPDFKAIVFDNTKLLLIGTSSNNENKGIYSFDVITSDLKFLGNMKYNRHFYNAILLKDNKTILITGGSYDNNVSNGEKTAEYFIIRR